MEYLYPILGKSDVEDFTEGGNVGVYWVGLASASLLPSHRVQWIEMGTRQLLLRWPFGFPRALAVDSIRCCCHVIWLSFDSPTDIDRPVLFTMRLLQS